MSRIDELIVDLCPDGVERKMLGEVFETRNGYTPSKANASNWTDGTVPWFRMEDIRENGRVLDDAIQHIPTSAIKGGRLFPANSIVVATSATIGEHALITVPFMANQRFTVLLPKPLLMNRLDMKFLFYYCFVLDQWCLNNTSVSSFASVDMAGFRRFPIPIPPLEVQREIVAILDTFTELEAQLENRLEAELEARKRQYEYYRDALLRLDGKSGIKWIDDFCPNGVERVGLGELVAKKTVALGRGQVISKQDIKNNPGNYPVYSSSRIGEGELGRYGKYMFTDERITWSIDGGGRFFYRAPHKYSVTNVCGWLTSDNSVISTRYLYYVLTTEWSKLVFDYTKKAHPSVIVDIYSIPIPPLEVQREIVNVLDKFDTLVNDLSIGLPAELEARRKQYEYYRDRLLTFKEAV